MSKKSAPKIHFDVQAFRKALLNHYAQYGRNLPWREDYTPYKVWLSEIMLQQTTVATVIPYFEKFLKHFPTIEDLAKADEQEVLSLWAGLGYYSRARNLTKCAKVVFEQYDSNFPKNEVGLLDLPGIGPYTAAAITSIAFNKPASVVDGNVERVLSRVFRIEEPLPDSKPVIKKLAEQLACPDNARDFSGAIMDLGATICTPKKPSCTTCPMTALCKSANMEDAETYPRKTPKKKKPHFHGTAFVIKDPQGRIYLQKRPDKGLLASLWEVPNQNWRDATEIPTDIQAIIKKQKASNTGQIKHVFTHFSLLLDVELIQVTNEQPDWFKTTDFPPLPTLMQKVLKQVI